MAESSTSVAVADLERCAAQLRSVIEQTPGAVAESADQLAAENAVAAGVAVLASEDPPEPATESSDRPTLAKDLLITVDLVLRSLKNFSEPPA